MRLIDEQGRLFGKVNLIDAAAVVVIACAVPFLLFAYSVLAHPSNKDATAGHPTQTATIGLTFWISRHEPGVDPAAIKAGDALFTPQGKQVGKIIDVEQAVIPGESDLMSRDTLDPQYPLVTALVDARVREREATMAGIMLRLGGDLSLRTAQGGIGGPVTRVYLKPPQWVTLGVHYSGVLPEVVVAVRPGDAQRDRAGKVVIRVKRVLEHGFALTGAIPGKDLSVSMPDKTIILLSNATNRELVLEVEAFCTQEGGQYFFYDNDIRNPIKLGNVFNIRTSRYDLSGGQITSIRSQEQASEAVMLERTPEGMMVILRSDNVSPEVAELVKVGDAETDISGEPVAVITDILNIDDAKTLIRPNPQSGLLLLADNPTERQLMLKVRLQCIRAGDVAIFKGQQIKIGSDIVIQTPRYDLQGKLVAVESAVQDSPGPADRQWQAKWHEVVLECANVDPEVAVAVQKDQTQADAAGNMIGKILSVEKRPVKSQYEVFVSSRSNSKMIMKAQTSQQDLTLTLQVLCVTRNGVPSFRGKALKLGGLLTFQTKLYDLGGRITEVREIAEP